MSSHLEGMNEDVFLRRVDAIISEFAVRNQFFVVEIFILWNYHDLKPIDPKA